MAQKFSDKRCQKRNIQPAGRRADRRSGGCPHPEVYLATEGEGVLEGLVSTGVPFVEQGVNGGCKSFSMVFGITEISFPS